MKVVVCIKQVPDTKGGVKFNPDGTLDRAAMMTIMNPDDKAGVEAALRLKDQYGAEVTVVTMGLPKAEDVLREAIAMGADKGVLVTDRVLGGADTWATSQTLAGALRNMEYDLIITGRQAIDGDTAQVGPQISEHLNIPVISYAQNLKIVDIDLCPSVPARTVQQHKQIGSRFKQRFRIRRFPYPSRLRILSCNQLSNPSEYDRIGKRFHIRFRRYRYRLWLWRWHGFYGFHLFCCQKYHPDCRNQDAQYHKEEDRP